MCFGARLFRIRGNDDVTSAIKSTGKIHNSELQINPQGPQNHRRLRALIEGR